VETSAGGIDNSVEQHRNDKILYYGFFCRDRAGLKLILRWIGLHNVPATTENSKIIRFVVKSQS